MKKTGIGNDYHIKLKEWSRELTNWKNATWNVKISISFISNLFARFLI